VGGTAPAPARTEQAAGQVGQQQAPQAEQSRAERAEEQHAPAGHA
jgi:hypothetical protein